MESAYDRALVEVGQNGLFQKKFDVIYNVVLVTLWSMSYMSIILVLVVIPHHCQLPEKPANLSVHAWKLKYIPTSKDANGQVIFNSCMMFENPDSGNHTKECDGYVYNKTWYESTVPSEYNWVCDKELNVANIFAYSRIGEIIGSIFFGWFGDVYGRRLTYSISLALIVVGRIISILAYQSSVLFVSGCIIASLPSWSVVQSTIVISIEISSPERRTLTATLKFAAFTFGVCIMSLLYWWLKEWKLVLTVTTAVLLPYLVLSWKIIESPRWLWSQGKPEECIKQLRRIAVQNKTKLQSDTEKDLFITQPIIKNQVYGPLALFSSWKLAFHTILQLCLWVSVTLSYTVLLMTSGEKKDGNPFLEFAWQAAAELPGNFIAAWFADHLGRRYTGVTSYTLTASMWILIAFREGSTNSWYRTWWVGTTLVTICRLSSTISYYTINLFNMELYPTCLRQSGMSLGNVLSSGASAVAPYVMYVGRRFDARLPGAILTSVSIIGIVSSYCLPETLNAKLPETIEDAHAFGSNRKYKSVPNTLTSST